MDIDGRAEDFEPPAGLLGCHVRGRAEEKAGAGRRRLRVGIESLGQTEVGDLGRALGVEQNVGGLKVAVDDPPAVGVMDRPGEALEQGDDVR